VNLRAGGQDHNWLIRMKKQQQRTDRCPEITVRRVEVAAMQPGATKLQVHRNFKMAALLANAHHLNTLLRWAKKRYLLPLILGHPSTILEPGSWIQVDATGLQVLKSSIQMFKCVLCSVNTRSTSGHATAHCVGQFLTGYYVCCKPP